MGSLAVFQSHFVRIRAVGRFDLPLHKVSRLRHRPRGPRENLPVLGCRFAGSSFEQFLFRSRPVLLRVSILATARHPITFRKPLDLFARGLRRLYRVGNFLFLDCGLAWLSGCLRLFLCTCHSNSLRWIRRQHMGHPLQGTKLLHDNDSQSGLVYLSAQQAVSGIAAECIAFAALPAHGSACLTGLRRRT